VLKKGGQCVATYPYGIGNAKLGKEMASSVWQDLKSMRFMSASKRCIASITIGIAYAPISSLAKPAKGFYSDKGLAAMLDNAGFSKYAIDEDKAYQDYVVSGVK
jgi:hypothetical protein